ILESPLTYDFLARPAKLKPLTLEAMPEITDGGRTYTLHVKPGIYFADDPAFGGKKRELVADDYAFAMKRLMDPKVSSPNLWLIEGRVAGIKEAIEKAKKAGHFDYDAKVPGLEVLDRYTLRVHLAKPDYNFNYILAMCTVGAQAREVVQRYGDEIGAHPVGTGPYRLAEWKRSSKIVLVKNENFREMYYDAEPLADDEISQQLLRENKGKRMPMVDRVEIYVIEEPQPRWLAFLNKELDWVNVPAEFLNMVVPQGKEASWAVKRGIRYQPDVEADLTYLYWNMKDPIVGGYTADKVALRRAIGLAYDNDEEIKLLRKGSAFEARTPVPPGVVGYEPDFNIGKTYDPAKSKALLDMFGYVDKDGDGWRDMADGSPLLIHYYATPSADDRQYAQLFQKNVEAVGLRVEVRFAKWPDLRKESKLQKLQNWALGWNADYPDGENFYQLLYGPNCGSSNDGCFQLPEFDAAYAKAGMLPPGPERQKLYDEMARLVAAYAPWKLHAYRKRNQLVQPWVLGWRKHPFLHDAYQYADIDLATRAKELK
ncbi:MAG TPA: ABC transporter substrate-binding protein, partial [Usitatibacter sp.]|nr:ABC transporter substrate-binding protein [Usitatibacter sp.]